MIGEFFLLCLCSRCLYFHNCFRDI